MNLLICSTTQGAVSEYTRNIISLCIFLHRCIDVVSLVRFGIMLMSRRIRASSDCLESSAKATAWSNRYYWGRHGTIFCGGSLIDNMLLTASACAIEKIVFTFWRVLARIVSCHRVLLCLVLSWVLRGLVLITRQFACLGVPCRLVLVARPAFLDVPWVEFHVGRLGWAPRSYCQACLRFY